MYLTVSITLECSLSVTWVCTEMPCCSLFLLQVLAIAVVLSCFQTLSTSWVWQATSRMPRPSCPPCRRIYLLTPTYQPTSSLLLQGYSELRVSMSATVGANKKFTFRLRATVILQCDRSSKNGRKFLLRKRNTYRLYGFRTVEVLERL